MKNLEGKKIAILATDGFEQSELMKPRADLAEAGASVEVISLEAGTIRAWDEDDWGETVPVDRVLGDADIEAYDALVLPGGQINPDVLRADEDAVDFIRRFYETGKPLAAICHAPWLLVEAGIADRLRATSYKSIRTDMMNAGALWMDESVVVDGGIITSRQPDDLDDFISAIASEVSAGERANRAAVA